VRRTASTACGSNAAGRLASKHSKLKPERSLEERVLRMIPDLDGKLPPNTAGERILRKIRQASRRFVSCRFNAIEHNAYLVANQHAVARVKEVPRHGWYHFPPATVTQ
jgi:hypothetical protein